MAWARREDIIDGLETGYSYDVIPLYVTMENIYTFDVAVEKLIIHVNSLLDELEPVDDYDHKLKTFVIGKTYASQRADSTFHPMQPNTWNLDGGVKGRWNNEYKRKGFDGMLVLCAVTQDILPPPPHNGNTQGALYNQQDYVLALEQQLIHHYAYVKQDPRLGNTSLQTGRRGTRDDVAGVLYLAFKFTDNDEMAELENDFEQQVGL